MYDAMTGPLKAITNSMNLLIRSFEQMQTATNKNMKVDRMLTAAKQQLASAEAQIRKQIEQANKAQQKFNRSVNQGKQNVSSLLGSMKAVVTTYLSMQSAKAVANVSDEYVNTMARLDLINDGLQTTETLQNKIFAAADRARGNYSDMASVVGKLGLLASDAFTSNDEMIAFAELMQKAFRVSGASAMEQQAGMYQLTQAMAAGRLQGDEFRSIMENAPLLAQAIADYTGKTKGELKEMSASGDITSDIIKGALFNAAEEIERRFSSMPRTFSDIWVKIKNTIMLEFGPAIQQISALLNDPSMKDSMRSLGQAIADAAVHAVRLVGAFGKVSNYIRNHWPAIEAILWGVVSAVIAWKVAQLALNIALTANPIGAIIMAIAALIGLIIFLARWIVNVWKNNDEFAAGLLRTWNRILNSFDRIPIFFTRIAAGIINHEFGM